MWILHILNTLSTHLRSGREVVTPAQITNLAFSVLTATNEDKMDQDEMVPILKPCPFCGDRPQIVRTGTFSVQCADCAATGPPAPSMERAAVRWNKRKGDDFG